MNKQQILIVDDEEVNRAVLAEMFREEYEILEAEDGQKAVTQIQNSTDIVLILLDIVMPVMDGFETLVAMNKNGWIKSIPVIMISAETVPAYVDRAYDLGVQDYISRPFDERTVRRRVINTIMLFAKQKELSHMVADQMMEKENGNQLMIEILSNIVEFRNGESGLHVLHIRTLTELFLKALLEKTDKYDISRKDIPLICNASALHDIGKIAVSDTILQKPGALTKVEYQLIQLHAEEGGRLIRENMSTIAEQEFVEIACDMASFHHEKWAGGGYPKGLKGEAIPLAARILAIADVFDALVSERQYKKGMSLEKAFSILKEERGVSFQPELLDAFLEMEEELRELMQEFSL